MTAVYATDLDRTLIYSARAAGRDPGGLVAVERLDGRAISFVSPAQLDLLADIDRHAVVVPVTTRTLAQYRRITVWRDRPPEWAVAANGGLLLHRGQPDHDWYTAVLAAVGRDSRDLPAVARWLGREAEPWIDHVRIADDLFLYTLVDRHALPAEVADALAATLDGWGFQLSIQGRKLYAVPHRLGKGVAVREVARRVGADRVLAAGDSLLDRDLLAVADLSLRPAHGELHDIDEPADVVTLTSGLAAGEELLRTVLARLGGDEAPGKAGGRVPPVRHAPVARPGTARELA
jgi:hydroxymethylpyrimidine pyrophosphatase-like HAD family hydrolase